MGNAQVRKAVPGDEELLSEIHVACMQDMCEKSSPNALAADLTMWKDRLRQEVYSSLITDSEVFVVELGSDGVAFGLINSAENEIEATHVHPSQLNDKSGSRILEQVEKTATQTNLTRIRIVASENSKQFLEDKGFVEQDHQQMDVGSRMVLSTFSMVKTLREEEEDEEAEGKGKEKSRKSVKDQDEEEEDEQEEDVDVNSNTTTTTTTTTITMSTSSSTTRSSLFARTPTKQPSPSQTPPDSKTVDGDSQANEEQEQAQEGGFSLSRVLRRNSSNNSNVSSSSSGKKYEVGTDSQDKQIVEVEP